MHELTEKLFGRFALDSGKEIADSIITSYLKECAERFSTSSYTTSHINEILGLSEKEKVKDHIGECNEMVSNTKELQKQEWCSHWRFINGYWEIFRGLGRDNEIGSHIDQIKYCSQCGAEKPKQLSLVERVADELFKYHCTHNIDMDVFCKKAAEIALEFLEKNK